MNNPYLAGQRCCHFSRLLLLSLVSISFRCSESKTAGVLAIDTAPVLNRLARGKSSLPVLQFRPIFHVQENVVTSLLLSGA